MIGDPKPGVCNECSVQPAILCKVTKMFTFSQKKKRFRTDSEMRKFIVSKTCHYTYLFIYFCFFLPHFWFKQYFINQFIRNKYILKYQDLT